MSSLEDTPSSSAIAGIPRFTWRRNLSQPEPSRKVHTFSRPPVLEALSLLNVAARVGMYINGERARGREPIFDLRGIALEPPNPGPYSGVPLGGMGGGNIGRGYRGDFRRWSLFPGKYNHTTIHTDVFCIRVKTATGEIHSKVLSCFDGSESGALSGWNWGVQKTSVTYHALFPRAWTVFVDPVPGVKVTIRQVSPFLPGSYSEASLPAACFHVDVENTEYSQDIEVSIMLCFENGNSVDLSQSSPENVAERLHSPFHVLSGKSNEQRTTGVCMSHAKYMTVALDKARGACDWATFSSASSPDMIQYVDQGSFSIAVLEEDRAVVSFTDMFYVEDVDFSLSTGILPANTLWTQFTQTGDLTSSLATAEHQAMCSSGRRVAAAICQRKFIPPGSSKSFSFSLTWDNPIARFGSGMAVPRYYTRFFGDNGLISPSIASYALTYCLDWERRIVDWQNDVQQNDRLPDFYKSQLFNELYFLCDGGVVWTDTTQGCPNISKGIRSKVYTPYSEKIEPPTAGASSAPTPVESIYRDSSSANLSVFDFTESLAKQRILKVSQTKLLEHDQEVKCCDGDQVLVGQFLYLEGHEYLMYNTYDVHFYSGFALLMLFPQLELSLQLDFSRAVKQTDNADRILLGTHGCVNIIGPFLSMTLLNSDAFSGTPKCKLVTEKTQETADEEDNLAPSLENNNKSVKIEQSASGVRPRKVSGAVPHDLGSPSEAPWFKTNIYNFQDVSLWKDLGPKFILQIYRDYQYTKSKRFLTAVYPMVMKVILRTEEFDTDDDGMIENSGFPDQTYDIWTATGIHAYSGGLWLAACMAVVEMAGVMGEITTVSYYTDIVQRGRKAYIASLWNGTYFNYDSSETAHHDSIMSDMLAGQWYADVCKLGRVVPSHMVHSSLRVIFENNVIKFGQGHLLGAVNGMKPTGVVDNSCLQSREVWTGTTYAAAALMLHEGIALESQDQNDNSSTTCSFSEEDSRMFDAMPRGDTMPTHLSQYIRGTSAETLIGMGFTTAQGIHDSGWLDFGYQFATPEAWEQNGNYRSQGYMRPLCIWAMQFALQSGTSPAEFN